MIWTNGAYEVDGELKDKMIIGIIVKTKYPNVYDIGAKVKFPLYHSYNDKVPQFELKIKKKLDYLINNM